MGPRKPVLPTHRTFQPWTIHRFAPLPRNYVPRPWVVPFFYIHWEHLPAAFDYDWPALYYFFLKNKVAIYHNRWRIWLVNRGQDPVGIWICVYYPWQ